LESEFVGIFVNKDLFEAEGLEVPQTISEALEFCRIAKERGYVPMAHSQSGGWQTYFSFTMPAHNYVGIDYIEKLLFEGEGRWDSEGFIEAMKITYEDMKEAGCFVEDLNALDFGGAIDFFNNQETFMLPTGTWVVGRILDFSTEHTVEMMPWFDMETGEPRAYTMGMGSAWFVSAASEHPDEAALFLDYLFSEEAVKIWIENASRIPPVPVDTDQLDLLPLQKFVVDTLEAAGTGQADIALGWDVDLIVPEEFNTMLKDGWQAVYAGTKTVEEQMADLQEVWEEFGPY
jgi:raffinose/stachyose/melibiose transport system substrate-binding protein